MTPFTVHIMTAALSPGDAIGNYILTQAAIFRRWGLRVRLYADALNPRYPAIALPAKLYHPTGHDILWYHYSIYSENIAHAQQSHDFKILDFHGVSPPRLFAGQNPHLEHLCREGLAWLPRLRHSFAAHVVHSEYARGELASAGYAAEHIYKLPLIVDTARLGAAHAAAHNALEPLLGQLEYLIFVGRLVPQKDILAMLELFAAVQRQRPHMVLVLVGSATFSRRYERQIQRAIKKHGLGRRVLLAGQVNNPRLLAQLLAHARLLLVTSEWESFCVPLVEAMYFGVPPVVHDIPPLPEVGGEAALVIDKRQPQPAAEAILALLDDPAVYAQRRTAARERAPHFTTAALEQAMLTMLCQRFGLAP